MSEGIDASQILALKQNYDQMDPDARKTWFRSHAIMAKLDMDINLDSQSEEWKKFVELVSTALGGSLDENQISIDYDRCTESSIPTGKKKPGGTKYGGSPTKEILHSWAAKVTVDRALAEIYDNIFDNYLKNMNGGIFEDPKDLRIHTIIHYKKGTYHYIDIKENSGGIKESDYKAINQPGISEGAGGSIGTFGQGLKIALAALGHNNYIYTNHITEQDPTYFHYDPSYYGREDNDWDIDPMQPDSDDWISKNKGCSNFVIGHVTEKDDEETYLSDKAQSLGLPLSDDRCKLVNGIHPLEHLGHWLGMIYAKKIRAINRQFNQKVIFTISSGSLGEEFNVTPVILDGYEELSVGLPYAEGDSVYKVISKHENRKPEDWKFTDSSWLEPIYFQKKFEQQIKDIDETRTLKLNMKCLIGATNSAFEHDSGAWMWGNGRLFATRVSGQIFGRGGGNLAINNQRTGRVFVFVEFEAANPRDIPWGSPIKWDYNPEHPIAESVGKILREYANRFLRLTNEYSSKGFSHMIERTVDPGSDKDLEKEKE